MTISKLAKLMSNGSYYDDSRVVNVLPRYAAMVGIEIDTALPMYRIETEVTMEQVREILALDYAERRTADLRAMGDGMGRISVNVPSNINVWQHVKGETRLAAAAESLVKAAEAMATR